VGAVSAVPAMASGGHDQDEDEDNVVVCHYTGSGNYNRIEVSTWGALQGHTHHSNDIINPSSGQCPGSGSGGGNGGGNDGGGGNGGGGNDGGGNDGGGGNGGGGNGGGGNGGGGNGGGGNDGGGNGGGNDSGGGSVPNTPAKPGRGKNPQLQMYKVEQHLTVLEDEGVVEKSVACPNGDIAADGMWRVDQVDYNAQLDSGGPYDLHNGVSVLAAENTDLSTYAFKVANNTESDVQLKLWVTCLGKKTAPDTHQHDLVVTGPKTKTVSWSAGQNVSSSADLKCASGEIAIAPGWNITGGSGEIFRSAPSQGLDSWQFGFSAGESPTTIATSVRCLKLKTGTTNGHAHKLQSGPVTTGGQAFDKGNGVKETIVNCGEHEKGLIGGFDVADGDGDYDASKLSWLGMDPRLKSRAYKTLGTGHAPELVLVCVGDRVLKA